MIRNFLLGAYQLDGSGLDASPVAEGPSSHNLPFAFGSASSTTQHLGGIEIALDGDLFEPSDLPDSEVIARTYSLGGIEGVCSLNGSFSVALWDSANRRLVLARDRFGSRPLFYRQTSRHLLFSSDISPLLGPFRPNRTRIAMFLLARGLDANETFHEDIFRVPPGSAVVASPKVVRHSRPVSWDSLVRSDGPSLDRAAHELSSALRDSVRAQTAGFRQVATTLSGGLDSTAVVCAASRLGHRHAVSAIFPSAPASDESARIQRTVDAAGLTWSTVDATNSLVAFMDGLALEEPIVFPGQYLLWSLVDSIRDSQADCVLTGAGGNGLVPSGWDRLNHLARNLKLVELLTQSSGLRGIRKQLAETTLAWVPPSWIPTLLAHRPHHSLRVAWRLLDPALTRDPRFVHSLRKANEYEPTLASSWLDAHRRRLASPVVSLALEQSHRLFSQFGMQVRFPLLDHRVIKSVLGLPDELFLSNGRTRLVLRESLRAQVPPEVAENRLHTSLVSAFVGNFSKRVESYEFHVHSYLYDYVLNANKLNELRLSYSKTRASSLALLLWRVGSVNRWIRANE